ncbi:hypothetical protein BJ322DRAFT_613977 [Thelephora terrestris]|uniref:Uncharacterized protein n=1 Tax=Thelephora terrestris TaxID=56493 RepID=A0A9P6HKH4_9AGAM|nr:hypothetical protein BJ322DRAFT_613977 [Thelephora terrestris]
MFQLPKTPHRPAAQNRLPPSPRRKRLLSKRPSHSPPRLRGSKVYRRRAPRSRPAPAYLAQDASPAAYPDDSPDVTYELTNPSSPLDRYNPTRKTAYKQLMIDYVPSSSKLLGSTSGNHGHFKPTRASTSSVSQIERVSIPKRTKFAPPEEVDDGLFFSGGPTTSMSLGLFGYPKPTGSYSGPVKTPTSELAKKPAYTIPPLSFALDLDVLDMPSPYYRFQADSTTDDLPTHLPCPMYPTSLARADGPAFAYYIN